MSYRINYSPEQKIPKRKDSYSSRIRVITAVFLVLFALGVKNHWPEGHERLVKLLLPGEPGVTQTALEDMVSDLGAGVPVSEAFTAFCRQIMTYEELPS